jgi:hypothetical protein
VYYRTTSTYLNSASRRRTDEQTGQANNNNVFHQDARSGPQENSFATPSTSVQSTQNMNSGPYFMSNVPTTPDYFVNTQADSGYSSEGSQHYTNDPSELYPQFSYSTSKPNYPQKYVPSGHWDTTMPHGSSESDQHGYTAEEHYSSHQAGMHSNYNPTATGEDNFHSNKHPSYYDYSNNPVYQQSDAGESRPATPNYGHDPGKGMFNPPDSHVQPAGVHQDESGYQSYPHKHNQHEQNFHEDGRPAQPPAFYPSDTQSTTSSSEMKNGPDDSDMGSTGTQGKRRLLPTDECGLSIGERIVGGKNAALGAYPWMARIGYTRE